PIEHFLAGGGSFPIILLTAKRTDQLKETLELLLKVRGVTKEQVTVLQDGSYAPTAAVVRQLGVRLVQNEGRTKLRGGAAQDGAALICSHYKFALGWAFDEHKDAPAVLVVEDDFYFSPDFLEYFEANAPLLDRDASTFVLSAWNDNGFWGRSWTPGALHRTEYFPGLGWLLTRRLWDELRPKWPKAHWDHFLRDPKQHKGRESVYPEVPRTFHNGKKGTFMDLGTHNKYFADIAYNTDATFRWPHPGRPRSPRPRGRCARARLAARLGGARPARRAGTAGALPRELRGGRGPLVPGGQSHPAGAQPFKPVGEVLGVWHEVEREPPAAARVRLGAPACCWWSGTGVTRTCARRPCGRWAPRDLQQGGRPGARGPAGAAAGGRGTAGGGSGARRRAGLRRRSARWRANVRRGAVPRREHVRGAGERLRGAGRGGGHGRGLPGRLRGVLRPGPARGGRTGGAAGASPAVPGHRGPGQSTCAARRPSTRRLCPCV
ncbi:unnamed protein product, partial [Heterosigma akashiwo]